MYPTLLYLGGGQCHHKIWIANKTIRRNVNIPPPVCSIVIHIDMIFCGEETGKDSERWPTIEFALISTAAQRAK